MRLGDTSEPSGFPSGLSELHPTLDALSTFIYVKDRDLHVVSANLAFCHALGVTRDELIGKSTATLLGDAGPESDRSDREVLAAGAPCLGLVESFVTPQGRRWVVTDKAPIKGPDGSIVGLVGMSIDVTSQREADERLARSEAQLRFLTDHMADILWIMDLDFHTTFVTPSVQRVLGFTPDERKRQRLEEMALPESISRIHAELAHQMQLEASGSTERDRTIVIAVEYYHKNGSTVWTENSVSPLRDEDGRLIGMVGVSRDITERKRAEHELQESARLLRETERLSHLGGWGYDPATRQMTWTDGAYAVHELEPDADTDLISTSANCYSPEARERVLRAFRRAVDEGLSYDLEVSFVTAKGTPRWVRTIGRPEVRDGVVVRVTGNIMDVTEQHYAADALRASEQKYRQLFEQSVDAVNLVGPDGRLLEANPAWYTLFGWTPDDAPTYCGRDAHVDPNGWERFLQTIALHDRIEDDVPFRRRDGSIFDCHRVVTARRDHDGEVVGYQTVFHDVTEQKRAVAALKESEERFRLVLSRSPAIIAQVDRELRYVWIYHPHSDFAQAGVLARRDDELADNEGTRQLMDLKQRVISTGEPMRQVISFPLSEGSRTFDVAAEPLRDDSGAVVGATTVSFDITERVAAEEALRVSEERYRQIFNQSMVPISLISLEGHIIEANDAWLSLLGYSREDIPRFNAVSLFERPEDREKLIEGLLRNGRLDNYVARIQRKDGTFIDAVRSISIRYYPDGSILGFQSVLRDVTELNRTRDELFASREQLRSLALRIQETREQERAAIAHDLHDHFSQELTALKFDLDALKRSLPPGDEQSRDRVMGISRMVGEMSAEVRRVISDIRPGMLDDLGLCAAIEWQAEQFSERSGISCDVATPTEDMPIPPQISTALFRVFQELLANVARYAEATHVEASLLNDADSVTLIVSDNGRGITGDELHSLDSLGILSIQERIRACQGAVTFRGEPGAGTTVTVIVPLRPSADRGLQGYLGLA